MTELIRDRMASADRVQTVTEPLRGTFRTTALSASNVHPARYRVRPSRCTDLGISIERRQRRQRAVRAVVGPTRNLETAVVDQLSVCVGPRISAHEESIAVTQRVLYRSLIFGPLHLVQPSYPDRTTLGRVVESCRCIGVRDIVAQLPDLVRVQPRMIRIRRQQPEVVAQLPGDRIDGHVRTPLPGALTDVDVQIRLGRIRGVHEIDEHPITGQQPLFVIETEIRCLLGIFPQVVQPLWMDVRIRGHVNLDPRDRDRAALRIRIPSNVERGLGIRLGLRGDRNHPIRVGPMRPKPITPPARVLRAANIILRRTARR
nr:hypothetical protein [Nocardia coffeae]